MFDLTTWYHWYSLLSLRKLKILLWYRFLLRKILVVAEINDFYSSTQRIHTGLFKMIVGVLTTCRTKYIWDRRICIFLFNRTTLQVFVTYLTGALYVHPLWFYKHQQENRVRSKLFVACQRWWFQWRFWFLRSKPRNA